MFATIRRNCRGLLVNKSGNATMLVALGMPILIGTAGAAIDISQWYSWKTELQQATDQAALAAAWSLANGGNQSTYTTRGKQDFTANLSLTSKTAGTPTFQLANYSNGSGNSVVVQSFATATLPFTSLLINKSVRIGAYSQASFAAGKNFKACLKSTGDNGTTFTIGGNANVVAHCGLAALSCSDNALIIDANAKVTTDSIAVCGTASVPDELEDVLTTGAKNLTDPFSTLTPPTNTTPQTYACVGKGNKAIATPQPGTYSNFTVKCPTTLAKGIYVINGGTLDLTGNYTVTGTSVMFVLKGGATIKLGGSGNGNILTLTPMQASDFIALGYSTSLSAKYANMLVFEDKNNNPTQDHIINGNSTSLFEGTIYLPAGTARLNGTASIDSSCLQISAKIIKILGNAYLDTRCPTAQTNDAGSSSSTVKLVA